MNCYYCNRAMSTKRTYRFQAHFRTTDHKIPRSRGGANTDKNRCSCCRFCNEIKADMTEHEFKVFTDNFGYRATVKEFKQLGLSYHTVKAWIITGRPLTQLTLGIEHLLAGPLHKSARTAVCSSQVTE